MGVIRYKSTGDMQDSNTAGSIKRINLESEEEDDEDEEEDEYYERRGASTDCGEESPAEEDDRLRLQQQQQQQQQRNHNYQFGFGTFAFGGGGGTCNEDDERKRRPLLGHRQQRERAAPSSDQQASKYSQQDKSNRRQCKSSSRKLADHHWHDEQPKSALLWPDKADDEGDSSGEIGQRDPTSWRRSVSKPNAMNSRDCELKRQRSHHHHHHHYQHHQLASAAIATATKRVRQTNGARRHRHHHLIRANAGGMRQAAGREQRPEQQVNLSLSSPALYADQECRLQQVFGADAGRGAASNAAAAADVARKTKAAHCSVDVSLLATDHRRSTERKDGVPSQPLKPEEEGQRQANDNNGLATGPLRLPSESNYKDNERRQDDHADRVNWLESRQPVAAGQWQPAATDEDTLERQTGVHCAPACQRAAPTANTKGNNTRDTGELAGAISREPAVESRTATRASKTGEQEAENASNTNKQQAQSQTLSGNQLMADLGSRLMGSVGYASTWHLALHSGSYKVAARHQQHQAAISAGQESQENGKQVAASRQSARSVSRCSRPGRSPISLQRQTNARLARHKLKIQQQRQDQLVQLALRDRQHLSSSSARRHLGNSNQLTNQQQTTNLSTLYTINGYLDGPGSVQARHQDTSAQEQYQRLLSARNSHVNLSGPSCGIIGNRLSQQRSSVIEAGISGAVEICDNQLACSSRQLLQVSDGSSSNQVPSQRRLGYSSANEPTNVVVYRSIDMIRNSNDSHHHHHHHLANSDKRSSKRSNRMAPAAASLSDSPDEIEGEDAQTICSSLASSTISLNKPFCKICHIGSSKSGDKLISPCRCSGTMQYIHCGCLLKWLEISNRTNEKPISCELCAHEYSWHKKFNYGHLRLPRCSLKDLFLHLIFILAFLIMISSALAPMLFRKFSESADQSYRLAEAELHSSKPTTRAALGTSSSSQVPMAGKLAHDEKFMLLCAASFFISFFMAIYVQTKARDTLYSLISKFLSINQTYYITEYDHGQLSANTNNNNNNNTNGANGISAAKSQYLDDPRLVRKTTQKS